MATTGTAARLTEMEALSEICTRIQEAFGEDAVELVENASPCAEHSLRVNPAVGTKVARWLKNDPELRLDYCSNATGVDYPDRVEVKKEKVKRVVDGEETEVTEETEINHPGYLEAVYHLFSVSKKHGPVVLRLRTVDRGDEVDLPSFTPVWRSCELQEREIYDLYGINFKGHPDLRRILMWDEFTDYPMRKDYVEPDDYEYEPTPHSEVLERAKAR